MADDAMDIVNEKQMQKVAEDLAAGAAEDEAEAEAGFGIAASAPAGRMGPSWNTAKYREEAEIFRTRLIDQGFSLADFGDPLSNERPLEKLYSRPFPEGTEERLKQLVAEIEQKKAAK